MKQVSENAEKGFEDFLESEAFEQFEQELKHMAHETFLSGRQPRPPKLKHGRRID